MHVHIIMACQLSTFITNAVADITALLCSCARRHRRVLFIASQKLFARHLSLSIRPAMHTNYWRSTLVRGDELANYRYQLLVMCLSG